MFSKLLVAALMSSVIFSSCSRPVAYFQPTAHEQFKSAPAIVATTPVDVSQPVSAETVSTPLPVSTAQQIDAPQQISQARVAINQLETYVRNDSKLASSKKLAKRMNRINELLSAPVNQSLKASNTQKTTFAQKLMLKQIDKKIKNNLYPERAMAKSILTIGAIIGIIGLILLLLNVAAPLGIIALIVGLVLILVDLLR
ncbi:hypothetical protein GO730_35550 [Spirosoma sp. HMF3257]|uniref:Uncharacterized protein n=3 Tax=Spirosoma telluris TaxID=2183553 RepID=A0A327NVQ4_9BACT|nr:hypothetical protein [Spirosoma telluris]RAI78076.1 hypothetical protein HMF3257_35455 [Spirosoma telluris]